MAILSADFMSATGRQKHLVGRITYDGLAKSSSVWINRFGEVQEMARQHVPAAIAELARLAVKAKSETARIAACRELLDRGYGKPRQGLEIIPPPSVDPIRVLLDEIAADGRTGDRYTSRDD